MSHIRLLDVTNVEKANDNVAVSVADDPTST
jgi:hypothetical protein